MAESAESKRGSAPKRPYKDLNASFAFQHVTMSLCNKSIEAKRAELRDSIATMADSEDETRLVALSSVLEELVAAPSKCMTLDEAFSEFAGKVPAVASSAHQKVARRTFKDRILSRTGLPIVILDNGGMSYVMLIDNPLNNIEIFQSIEYVLSSQGRLNDRASDFVELGHAVPDLMKLSSTAKDRGILMFVLSAILSSTQLSLLLGTRTERIERLKKQVNDILSTKEQELENAEEESSKQIEQVIAKLQMEIEKDAKELELKAKEMNEVEKEDKEFDVERKKKRKERLQKDEKQKAKKRLTQRLHKKWKQSLLSQKGKGKGKYRIDRGAEQAVYEVLQEQLQAHRRRWGEEGTGYLENDRRVHTKDMQRIANRYLTSKGKKPALAKETVRSWGRCRNKRSRQAKQHRGLNLWAHLRTEKKQQERHINIHYNRAHVKNYTRLAFSSSSQLSGKNLVIRRAMDDKAYVRCGTSEGFCRPLHTPVQLTSSDDHFKLPTSDYPDPVGYVSPGVILVVKDMKETEHRGRDKFAASDVSIVVNSKPKHVYSSSATNWSNDLNATRQILRHEHEVEIQDPKVLDIDDMHPHLQFTRDSLLQFELMTIEEDFVRAKEGGDHLSREKLRVNMLKRRLEESLDKLEGARPHIGKVLQHLSGLLDKLRSLEAHLSEQEWHCVDAEFVESKTLCNVIRKELDAMGLPRHRPVDIQTSDAGPGVSSHERMCQIRMAEYFMLHSLDMQTRFHYAPGDSCSHIVEQVMRSLNECLGDGRTIPVSTASVVDERGNFKIKELNNEEIKRVQMEEEEKIAKVCAEKVKERFKNKRCMGTSIISVTPSYEEHKKFFFDETYMMKCSSASSSTLFEKCAGKAYFSFVKDFFARHYRLYDNGFEGIRSGCEENGPTCHYHENIENREILTNGWSGLPLKRVPAPVPDYSLDVEFHYAKPDDIAAGNLTEKNGLKKEAVMDTISREVDDFCPRKNLEELITSCGNPDLSVETETSDDSHMCVVDKNDTLGKLMLKVDDFAQIFTGLDLKLSVTKEINRRYNAKVKAFVNKRNNASEKASEKAKMYNDFDWENLITRNELSNLYVSQIDLYLMENLQMTKKDCARKGFSKAQKIEEVKKHFYSKQVKKDKLHTAKTRKTNFIHIAVGSSLPGKSTSVAAVQVLPWGGSFTIPLHGEVTLVNTCTIDNFLTMLYILMKEHKNLANQMSATTDLYAASLMRIVHMFDNGNFVDGKLEWMNLFPGRFQTNLPGQIDLWGNEEELFVSRLNNPLTTVYQSSCSSQFCPFQVKQIHAAVITLSASSTHPRSLQHSLDEWLATDLCASRCGLRLSAVPPGACHFLGNCLRQDPTGTLIPVVQAYCGGMRASTRRIFVQGAPPFLFVSLDLFSRNGILTEASQLPGSLDLMNRRYQLVGLTFWSRSGGHYRGAVRRQTGWFYYDGLWERSCKGKGLIANGSIPSTPAGFILSHSVFVDESLL